MSYSVTISGSISVSWAWADGQEFDATPLWAHVVSSAEVGNGPYAALDNVSAYTQASGNSISISPSASCSASPPAGAFDGDSAGAGFQIYFGVSLSGAQPNNLGPSTDVGVLSFENYGLTLSAVCTPNPVTGTFGTANFSNDPLAGWENGASQVTGPSRWEPSFSAICAIDSSGNPTTFDATLNYSVAITVPYDGIPAIPKAVFSVNANAAEFYGALASWPYIGHLVSGAPVYDGLNAICQLLVAGYSHTYALGSSEFANRAYEASVPVPYGRLWGPSSPSPLAPGTYPLVDSLGFTDYWYDVRKIPAGTANQDFSNLLGHTSLNVGAATQKLLAMVFGALLVYSGVFVFLPYADDMSHCAQAIQVPDLLTGGAVINHASVTIGSGNEIDLTAGVSAQVTLNGQPFKNATVVSGVGQPFLHASQAPLMLPQDFRGVSDATGKTATVFGLLPFISRWVTASFVDPASGQEVDFSWNGPAVSAGPTTVGMLAYEATLKIVSEGPVTNPADGSSENQIVLEIAITSSAVTVSSGTPQEYLPNVLAAISLPTGGGSPRLILAASRLLMYQTTQTEFGQMVVLSGANKSTTVRVAISKDFGETFESGVDIQPEASDGTVIADGLTQSIVNGSPVGSGFYFPVATQLEVMPNGRIFVNGYSMTAPGTISNPTQDWKAARITDVVDGSKGWRNAQTVNGAMTLPGTGNVWPKGRGVVWGTPGAFQGTKGSGGKSGGPSALLGIAGAYILHSLDFGDTWAIDTPAYSNFSAYQPGGGHVPRTAIVHQRGQSYDGAMASSCGYRAYRYNSNPGANPTEQPFSATTTVGGIAFCLAQSAEGEVMRAFGVANGQVVMCTARAGLQANVVNTANWSAPQAVMVSPTGDGNNLAPLAFAPKFPILAASPYAQINAFAWMQRIVLLVALNDTIQAFVSENDGKWFRPTVYTKDNTDSWPKGLASAFGGTG